MLRAMFVRSSLVSVLVLGSASLVGCAHGEVRQVIRAQFASELSCPEVTLKKRDTWYAYEGPDQYKVIGCGVVRTYTCPAGDGMASYDEPACTWVNGDADAPQMAKVSADADDGAPPMEGGEPMDADQELDAAEGDGATSASGGGRDDLGSESSDPEPAEASEPEPAPKKANGKAGGKGGVKASGGLKLGGKKK
jgi:hypothetical protein